MPPWLAPRLVAQISSALLLTLVFFYLHRRERERCTWLWAWSFANHLVWIVFENIIHLDRALRSSAWLLVASQGILLVSGFFLLWGTVIFIGRPFSRQRATACLLTGAANCIWIICGILAGIHTFVIVIPTCLIVALVYAATGIVMLRSTTVYGVGKWVAGWAFVAWACCMALYPLAHYSRESSEWSLLLVSALSVAAIAVAVGFLLAYFEKAQRSLGNSEQRFRSLFEKAAIGMILADTEGRLLESNEAFRKMMGYPATEIGRLSIASLSPADGERDHTQLHHELVSGKRDHYQIAKRFVRADDKIIWGRLTASLVYDEAGAPKYVIGMLENLTRRRRAEAARRASEDRFRSLVQRSGSAVICLSADHKILEISGEAARLFGWRRDEALGKDYFELSLGAVNGAAVARELREVLEGRESWDFECVVTDENGADKTYMWHAAQMTNSRERHAGIIAIGQDITRRKMAEEALRASEGKYRELFQDANSIIMRQDVRGKITFFNEFAQKFFGYAEHEILGKNVVGAIVPKRDSSGADLEAMIRNIGKDPDRYAANENENILRDGRRVWVAWTNKAIRDDRGRVVEILCVGNDITRTQLAEKALRESEERYRFLYNNTPVMLNSLDAEGRIIRVSDYWLEVMGFGREEVIGRPMIDFFTESSRDHAQKIVMPEFHRMGMCMDVPLSAVKKSGEVIDVLLSATEETAVDSGNAQYLAAMTDVTERNKAELALRESEKRYRLLFNSGVDAVFVHHLEADGAPGNFIEVNDIACQRLGYTREQLSQLSPLDIIADMSAEAVCNLGRRLLRSRRFLIELFHETSKGAKIPVEVSAHLFEFGGKPSALLVTRDVTERKHLEGQLLQSQKMEAVGRLAGGVAHDFNNILTVIMGYSELLLSQMEETDAMWNEIMEIQKSGARAVALVRQLLAFSRRQVLLPQALNLNTVAEDMAPMLQPLIGEDIELIMQLDPDLGQVRADPAQLEQVIMNLAVNARDAMPSGGKLVIQTREVAAADLEDSDQFDVVGERYVQLSVSDTGSGMDEQTLAHLFEPFFSTKEQDKGTGLGLATVYGIVRQSGGYIAVQSEPDKGSEFRVFLPRVDEDTPEQIELETLSTGMEQRDETIMVVEDEPVVRALVCSVLRVRGYKVLEAGLGSDALRIAERYEEPIHLILTDVVMPHMSGVEVAQQFTQLHPEARVLYMSGYTDESLGSQYGLDPKIGFVQKPFSSAQLTAKVQQALDAGA